MAEEMSDWKPMEEDFECLKFNSYGSGQTAALLPSSIQKASQKSERQQNLKLYMDGFPSDLTEEGLKNFLKRIGCQFLGLKIIRREDPIGKKRSFAFVDFESTKAAQKGIQLLKTQNLFKLFICLTASENERKESDRIKDKEFQKFIQQLIRQKE